MDILEAIKARTSVRAFLPDPVPQKIVSEILSVASFAASSKNTQPWSVAVVTSETKQKIADFLVELSRTTSPNPFLTIPEDVSSVYKQRAVKSGVALYSALQIERDESVKRQQQWEKNFQFFNAPVGLFFFMEPCLENGAILDCGLFIQNVMLAALAFGLATCPQRSLAYYPEQVKAMLGEEYRDKLLLTGMALGYPDTSAPENNYRTERAGVGEFAEFFN